MTSKEVRESPRFKERLGKLSKEMDGTWKELFKEFPAPEGWTWGINAVHEIGLFPVSTAED